MLFWWGMHVCWEDLEEVARPILLRLELKTKTKLVASSVDVFAIEESREGQLDTWTNTDTYR